MKVAMILAAGRGERLKPLTAKRPKAMCQVDDKPLIEHHVENLARVGFERIVINHAYLGDQIRRYLGDGKRWNTEICYSPEPPGGLETGGGIHNALPLLGYGSFVAVNADVFTDYPFTLLTLPDNAMAHLVLVSNPQHNRCGDFGLRNQQLLSNENKHYTFAGIAYYRAEMFQYCKPGRYSLTPLLRELTTKSLVTGALHDGLWIDIGSVERLELANRLSRRRGG